MLNQRGFPDFKLKPEKPVHYYVVAYLLIYVVFSLYYKAYYSLFFTGMLLLFLMFFKKRKVSHYLAFVIVSSSFLFLSVRSTDNYLYFVSFIYFHIVMLMSLKKRFFTTNDISLAEIYKKMNFYFRWMLRVYSTLMYFVLMKINLNTSLLLLILAVPYLAFLVIHSSPTNIWTFYSKKLKRR